MAHFAKLGINGKVLSVEVVADADTQGADGTELESIGVDFLNKVHGWPLWAKTSYNTMGNKHSSGDDSKAYRGNYAGIGYTWDEDNNIFWPKKPYASWVKDTATASWKSPIGDAPALTAEQISQNEAGTHSWGYGWNEEGQSWDLTDTTA